VRQDANRYSRRDHLFQAVLLLCLLIVIGLAALAHAFDPLDLRLTAWRMASSPRTTTGEIVVVEIDKKSLDAIGTWPWNRSVHATLVNRLVAAEARDIFLDIDFSTRSEPAGDAALASSLKAAGGGVILPSFQQNRTSAGDDAVVATTTPNALFAPHAWIASASLRADADGIVRRFPFGMVQDDGFVLSVPALLSGVAEQNPEPFLIDFSIDANAVTRLSAIDVMEGRADPQTLHDKIVIVGASAIELKDNFIVPVHGLVSGPMVHVLATETLLQDRRLVMAPMWWPLVGTAFAIALALSSGGNLRRQALVLVGAAVVLEAAAFWMQAHQALILPTAASLSLVVLMLAGRAAEELDLRAWLLRRVSTEANNTRNLLEQVITDSADMVVIVDDSLTILRHSVRLLPILPTSAASDQKSLIFAALPAQWQAEVTAALSGPIATADPSHLSREIHLKKDRGDLILEYTITVSELERGDGRERNHGAPRVVCLTARDVTEKRQQAENIAFLSRHDVVTGALRASALISDLNALAPLTLPDGQVHAVIAVNLHRFKTINSTLGRAKGDALLRAVTQRLGEVDAALSRPARLGNDSFALHTTHPVSPLVARRLAERVRDAIAAPFKLNNTPYSIGANLGLTLAGSLSENSGSQLIAEAELALDQARRGISTGIVEFDPETGVRHAEARQLESALWHALERGQIKLFYQPQVDLETRRIIGAEALMRWQHPQHGMISPLVFIGIAEANGFIGELGAWALRQACLDASTWPDQMTVAVNVAPLQLHRRDIVEDVRAALAGSGLPADRLHLEITESSFIAAADDLVEKLHQLKAMGVGIALDDFGSGYSSLGYLARFPLDKIKVDQMFIRKLTESASSQAIVSSVAALSIGLNVTMLCEGVETEAQADHLRRLGCPQVQGYLFGKPQPAEAFQALVTARLAPLKANGVIWDINPPDPSAHWRR
jgi:diguanylate cyclase (GGDEF)-like protein